ncbi:hypothetical protein FLW53_28485 [Microbispora sp. SCL1-1]|nr:hypothetical protein FLW53_28485 [Microbispora sp. SCL1-1]
MAGPARPDRPAARGRRAGSPRDRRRPRRVARGRPRHLSANGRPSRTFADIGASSDRELLTTEQLAVRLGVSERHARRLASLAGIRPAARNAWHRDDVAHLADLRRNDAAAARSAPAPERGP